MGAGKVGCGIVQDGVLRTVGVWEHLGIYGGMGR